MINNNNKLNIFENFETDRNLPKYTKAKEVELTGSLSAASINGATINGSIFINTGSGTESWGTVAVPSNNWGIGSSFDGDTESREKEKGWFGKWIDSFRKKKEGKKMTMTIINFFTSLATSLNDIKVLQDTAIHYEQAISNAAKAGQTALVDRLKGRLESAKSELQLVNVGLTKYLVEEQIVDFYKKTSKDKKLKLTWIKHFVKPIPSKILEVKEKLDQQFIFDNYAILHYDPNGDATSLTEEEKKQEEIRKKDPIIFGVIKGSRRLYYVGDWIDDYCNLTLDVVVEVLKERVNEVNNEKVKTYLDTGLRADTREKLPQPSPHYSSGTTIDSPSIFEEVKESMIEKIIKPFTRKKTGVKQKPIKPIKTSSAKKLKKLGKKKNGSK